jgi:hypothetical protein
MAAITPYFALGNVTPLILDGLSSSLLSSDILIKKRALQLSSAQILFNLPIGNIVFMVVCTVSFLR